MNLIINAHQQSFLLEMIKAEIEELELDMCFRGDDDSNTLRSKRANLQSLQDLLQNSKEGVKIQHDPRNPPIGLSVEN